MMRPRSKPSTWTAIACLSVCSFLSEFISAQTSELQPRNLPASNVQQATVAIPPQAWNRTGPTSPQLQPHQPRLPTADSALQPQPNAPLANLRPNTTTHLSNSGLAVSVATPNSPGSRQLEVVQASHESQEVTARTPLPPKSKSDGASQPKSGGSTLQTLLSLGSSLAIVIGLFLGVAVLYRKTVSTALGRGLPKNVVQVLGRTAIAPRQQMLLLRFGSKLVLVSMIQGEARTISEISDPLEVDRLAGLCEGQSAGSSTSSFREILTQGART